jgi:Dolichyl-phosphate-mannose-protein mannosyltransferase
MLLLRRPSIRSFAVRAESTGLALPVGTLLAAFAALRMAYAGGVEPDESDLILFGQRLAWGYSEQPPLYSWLCAAAFELFGTGVAALVAVRTAILAATVAFLVAAARRAIPDCRLATLAAASVLLVPSLAWHALTYLTHSILVFLAGVACLYFVLRIVQGGRARDYVFLGVACAAGALAKYNFAFFAFALLVAAASLEHARRRLLDPRIGLTAATFALLVAPHAVWLYEHRTILREELLLKVTHTRAVEIGRLARSAIGLREVATNSLLAAGPLALAVVLTFRGARGRTDAEPAAGDAFAARLLGRFLAIALASMVAMVLANGWDRFHERWLMPFMLVMPLWLFARLNPSAVEPRAVRRFGLLLAALAVAYLAVRSVQVLAFADRTSGLYPLRLDFTELARAIESEAGSRPLILVKQREVGGNLKLAMPGARVLCCYGNLHDLPPEGGPIVIAWNPVISHGRPKVPWSWIQRYWGLAWPHYVPPDAVRAIPVAKSGPNGQPATVMFTVLK